MELCKDCNSGCCRRFLVYLLGMDIIRISKTLKIDLSVFVDAIPLPEDKIQLHLDNKAPIFKFKEADNNQYFVLTMKSVKSSLYPEADRCLFLMEFDANSLSNGLVPYNLSRCGIHSCRPSICKTFPASYYPNEGKIKIKDPFLLIENDHPNFSGKEPYKLCPKPLEKNDYQDFTEDYAKDSVFDVYENEFFLQVSEKWNKNPDFSDKLYDFILNEYRNRIEYIKE